MLMHYCYTQILKENITNLKPNSFNNKVLTIPMKTQDGLNLYQKWVDQALSHLFATVANQK